MELDGTIIGKFGKAGKGLGEFSTVHEIDCRNPNELFVVGDLRVARAEDHPESASAAADRRRRDKEDAMKTHHSVCLDRGRRSPSAPRPARAADGARDSVRLATPILLKLPDDIHLGEAAGVATNSKGDIFVYTRTGHPDASRSARRAPFVARRLAAVPVRSHRQVRARDRPGRLRLPAAQQVRVDPQDNVWVVDSDVDAGDQVRSERPRRR